MDVIGWVEFELQLGYCEPALQNINYYSKEIPVKELIYPTYYYM